MLYVYTHLLQCTNNILQNSVIFAHFLQTSLCEEDNLYYKDMTLVGVPCESA